MSAMASAATEPAGDLLVATDCTKRFGGLVAVHDVDFTIPRGSIVSLIGPNGAGKTTFFNMITGLYIPTEGRIVFDGRDITGSKPHEVVRYGIARTFQNIRLFGNMSAEDNVLVGLHHRLKGRWFGAILRPRRRRPMPGPRSCLTSWVLDGGPRRSRATCRTAISAAWRSHVRWPRSRSCCSSTSRRPG
jgi:ABC-type uncharacterized transport system ATPase subunit